MSSSSWLVSIVLFIVLVMMLRSDTNGPSEFLHGLAPFVVPREKVYHHHLQVADPLPERFRYINLTKVRSQGKCAACWAFAIASCLSDRLCVQTRGGFNENLSVQEMLSCFAPGVFPCTLGGIPELAYRYAVTQGLHVEDRYPYANYWGGAIPRKCDADAGRPGLGDYFWYEDDRHEKQPSKVFAKAGSVRSLCDPVWTDDDIQRNVRNMKREIFANGPIVGTVMVYSDLYSHKTGVYSVGPTARFRGGHAVVIVGWDEESWVVKNSWGTHWPKGGGEEPGYFRIRRGVNEAEVESRASAALPLVAESVRQRPPRYETMTTM